MCSGVVARVGELMKDGRWKKHRLPGCDLLPLGADANFSSALQHHVNFLLLLIVPGHLAAIRLEHDIAHGESFRGNRLACLADHPACPTAGGKRATGNLGDIGDDHDRVSTTRRSRGAAIKFCGRTRSALTVETREVEPVAHRDATARQTNAPIRLRAASC